jgi:TRAP-type C4-dicarboxylate transport system permease small subunit
MASGRLMTGVRKALANLCFALGALALLVAMASDAAAVAGRHAGLPFLGAIELVQACVVVATSSAMVGATLSGAHATVHILLERVSVRVRRGLQAFAAVMGAACFAWLAAGSIWIVSDLWGGHERTELLGLPIMPLRLFWCASALLMVVLFAVRAVASARGRDE